MDDYIKREDVERWILTQCFSVDTCPDREYVVERMAKEILSADVVERSVYDQVAWERDTALSQLAEIGKGLGERMDDVVERNTGRWIYDMEAYPLGNPYGHYECDQCGESVPHETNFCPNCGKRMEES